MPLNGPSLANARLLQDAEFGEKYPYLGFLLFFRVFEQPSLDTVLLHLIAVFQSMLVRACHAVGFLVTAVPIDSLDSVILSPSCSRMAQGKACAGCQHTKRLRWRPPGLTRSEEIVCSGDVVLRTFEPRIFGAFFRRFSGVFGDLDFHVAEIPLTSSSLSLSFLGIIGLGCSWRPPFQTTVPIMGYEGFSLVTLRRSMRVNVVNVREVCIKPEKSVSQGTSSNAN